MNAAMGPIEIDPVRSPIHCGADLLRSDCRLAKPENETGHSRAKQGEAEQDRYDQGLLGADAVEAQQYDESTFPYAPTSQRDGNERNEKARCQRHGAIDKREWCAHASTDKEERDDRHKLAKQARP